MLKNYFKVAVRSIQRNKLYAFLNVFGLSVGLASFFLIYLFLNNELSYDKFHQKSDRIYRAIQITENPDKTNRDGGLTAALAPEAGKSIPEIEAWSRVESWPKRIIVPSSQSDSTEIVSGLSVDPGFLQFFDLSIIMGSPKEELFENPNEILVSRKFAERHFQNAQAALGQQVTYRRNAFTIKSIFEDIPETSSLKGEIIGAIEELNAFRQSSVWTTFNISYFDQSYFLLADGANVASVEEKLNKIYADNGVSEKQSIMLQPISEVHFSLEINDAVNSKTDRQYVMIFISVAAFILICSVFNYISLSLSQALERMKEIGVRKVVGARGSQLTAQFLIEAVINISFAFILAIVLVEIFVPELEGLLGRSLEVTIRSNPEILLIGFGFSLLLAVLAGLYPAYIGSRQKAIGIFKRQKSQLGAQYFVNGITIFQLIVFMVLISVAFTAKRQISFMQNENLGFDRENQLVIQMFSANAQKNGEAFRNALDQMPFVQTHSLTTSIPTRVMGSMRSDSFDFNFFNFNVDQHYLRTMDMELLAGRNFEPTDMGRDDLVMLNATAVDKLGWTYEEAVGQTLRYDDSYQPTIIGVINDFHFLSKKQPIEATLFKPLDDDAGVLVVKLAGNELLNEVDQIKETFADYMGDESIKYFFLQDQINSQYKQERIIITVINSFTILAAIVAILGLFGMAGYATKRRLKEMSIRKVLGAGFFSIQRTLNWSNLLKFIISSLIGIPLIYFWMNDWLSSFAYQIDFPVMLVGGALLTAIGIVFATVAFHSIRAYMINPVEILKDE